MPFLLFTPLAGPTHNTSRKQLLLVLWNILGDGLDFAEDDFVSEIGELVLVQLLSQVVAR